MKEITVGFIGFGLIGGSIAIRLKELNPKNRIIAYNHRKDSISHGLKKALQCKVLDKVANNLLEDFKTCDLIFLCGPVLSNITYLSTLKDVIKEDCLITDVGSVKSNIHDAVSKLGLNHQFIGGHPMTGSEKTGFENASSQLLENAYYILTPTKALSKKKVSYFFDLVKEMGSIPLLLDYKEHDDITAAISHVPHIIASSLVTMVKSNDDSRENMRTLAAGGFKDITRIASSSPTMWQNICLTNINSIRHFLDKFIKTLQEVDKALADSNGDFLYEFFDSACEYRNSIPTSSRGILDKVFEIYLDIADKAGSIASIATLLANHTISIKNIGIIHNREFEQGVLKIEFYDEESQYKASSLLRNCGYIIYDR